MPAPRVNFRACEPVALGLAARGARLETNPDHGDRAPGYVAERDLVRYYALLNETLKTITLSEGEASLICDVLNSTLMEPHTMKYVWVEVEDSLPDGTAEQWGVDGPALVAMLRGLTYAQAAAVVDAAERWWCLPPERRTIPDGLKAVGLVR